MLACVTFVSLVYAFGCYDVPSLLLLFFSFSWNMIVRNVLEVVVDENGPSYEFEKISNVSH